MIRKAAGKILKLMPASSCLVRCSKANLMIEKKSVGLTNYLLLIGSYFCIMLKGI